MTTIIIKLVHLTHFHHIAGITKTDIHQMMMFISAAGHTARMYVPCEVIGVGQDASLEDKIHLKLLAVSFKAEIDNSHMFVL